MNKIISLLLAVILCLTGIAVSASEVGTQSIIWGDADGDGELSILDATCIQRYLASLVKDDQIDKEAADITGDGIDILDATMIQRYLANFDVEYPIDQPLA